jgi:hypothetical protein
VLCIKLWSVRGGETVRVIKCVILASIWASNCLLGKATKRPVKGLERGPYGPKINGNLIKCHLQVFCDNPGGFQKLVRVPKIVCYSSRKSPETDVFRKKKIRPRLAQRPTLVVLCLKLLSVRGGGTVRVTKCAILASVWAGNCLLGNATKRPVKGLQRGPYGPKIIGNLIKCFLQWFCDNPGGFQKIGPGAQNRVLAHENRTKRTFSWKNKIRTRLVRRPTLLVLCLKLWSVHVEWTVRVTKCVTLAPVWANNCLLRKVTKWPVKGLELGP